MASTWCPHLRPQRSPLLRVGQCGVVNRQVVVNDDVKAWLEVGVRAVMPGSISGIVNPSCSGNQAGLKGSHDRVHAGRLEAHAWR